jgi:hypothetical protein
MAKQEKKPKVKKPIFDERKFFEYLRQHADSSFLRFLRSIDSRACVEMCTYFGPYLRPFKERQVFAVRKLRKDKLIKALSATIRAIQKTSARYNELNSMQFEVVGPRDELESRGWTNPPTNRVFPGVLENEENRLTAFLKDRKKLYTEKRFGVSGNHLWLVKLEEFVLEWTRRELGKAHRLRSTDIATMISAGRVALGWREDKTEADAELIRKAMNQFRKNRANAWLLSKGIPAQAQDRCNEVADGPYLLGIEI